MEYLVDIETLKKRSYINSDVNDEIVRVTLKRVQDRYLEPAIGSPLFKRLLTGVRDSDLNTDEVYLIENYILDFLCVGCELKSSTHNNWKIRNKAVGTANDEHVNSNNVSEFNNYRDELRKDLSFYKNKLIGYLTDNDGKFPKYKECNNKEEDIKPEKKGSNYSNKISFI